MGNSMGGFKEYWDLIRKYLKFQGAFGAFVQSKDKVDNSFADFDWFEYITY